MTGAELDRRLFNGEAVEVAMELFAENQRLLSSVPSEGERETRRRVASAAFDMGASIADKRDAEIAALKARAEKAEAERDAALAACAEMRAALESVAIANTRRLGESRRAIEAARALLSRPDLGRWWASPEDTAQMVGALQMVESDGEFDSLHEVTRKFVVDVLALIKKGGW